MSELENVRMLAQVAFESNAHEDTYKYSSRILELDINDAAAWTYKGIAAAYLTDTTGSKIPEAFALIKKGMQIGIDEIASKKIVSELKKAYSNYVERLNDEILGQVKDHQKVAMPAGGSPVIHGFGQALNKILVAQKQGPARVKGLELIQFICEVSPTQDNYAYALLMLDGALIHSNKNGKYLDGQESFNYRYREIKDQIQSNFKRKYPDVSEKVGAPINTNKNEGCFIATAATGSYDHPKVITLRKFRDNVLLTNSLGKIFVKLYYKISPSIANKIANSNLLKRLVMKIIVNPAVKIIGK